MDCEEAGVQQPLILFVDDSAALLRSVERLLRMEGFRVLLAADGQEALRRLSSADPAPDLIISDIGMPLMDGFQLYEAVRNNPAWLDIPFLFLTARDEMTDVRRGYSLGVDDYLVKPLDQERLLLVVRSKLKRRRELFDHIHTQRQAIEAAKQNLATMVAHELRTPLVSINIVTEILAQEFDRMDPDQMRQMLDALQSGSVRMSRLVEQIVMYVQLQSGSLRDSIVSRLKPCRIHDLVVDAVERARQYDYRQRRAPVRLRELAPEAQTRGDVPALCHALAEVILNAISFSSPESVVTVHEGVSGDYVQVAVEDAGPGIPPVEIARVSLPFHQVNRSRFEQQGIGMGLALAKGIVEAHGGTLHIQSEQGHGTIVTLSLPLFRETS